MGLVKQITTVNLTMTITCLFEFDFSLEKGGGKVSKKEVWKVFDENSKFNRLFWISNHEINQEQLEEIRGKINDIVKIRHPILNVKGVIYENDIISPYEYWDRIFKKYKIDENDVICIMGEPRIIGSLVFYVIKNKLGVRLITTCGKRNTKEIEVGNKTLKISVFIHEGYVNLVYDDKEVLV